MVFKAILTRQDIRKITADFKKVLQKAGVKLDGMILFGSYASGRPHQWSDIDICVLSRQFGRNDYDDMLKLSKLGKQVSYLIEAHPLNPTDFKQGVHPLAMEIRKTGKRI